MTKPFCFSTVKIINYLILKMYQFTADAFPTFPQKRNQKRKEVNAREIKKDREEMKEGDKERK